LTLIHGKTNSVNQNIALLGAFCLFLSAVEYMIPKPLPFLRIGLANLPLMLALDIFSLPSYLILVCIKVIGQGLITGTLFSYIFIFSMTGTFLSALIMFLLRRAFGTDRVTFIGIGTAGAFVSNISQLFLARVFIFQENVRYIAPPFLAVGIVTGIALGVFCEVFIQKSVWYREQRTEKSNLRFAEQRTEKSIIQLSEQLTIINERIKRRDFYNNYFGSGALFTAGLFILPALLFNPSAEYRVLQFLFFWLLAFLCGKKTNPVFTILMIIFIIAFNLIIPYGRVLFSAGIFKITSGALTAGIHRAVTLAALIMLSKVTIRQDLTIPGAFGHILSESLRIFSVIMSKKFHVTGKNIFTEIDTLMLEICNEQLTEKSNFHFKEAEPSFQRTDSNEKIRTKPVGYVILIIVAVISWLPWINIYGNF